MDNPRSLAHRGQTLGDSRASYRGEQRGRAVRRHARHGALSIKNAAFGAFFGIVAVVALCVVEDQPIFWQTAVWETGLCALAGLLLGRVKGGPVTGLTLFGLAYAGALFARESAYSGVELFARHLPAREVTVHGDFAALCGLAILGAFLGFLNNQK